MSKTKYAIIILIAIFIGILYLNKVKPPIIESQIGNKFMLEESLKDLKKDNLVFIISEFDYLDNTYTYEIYDNDSIEKKGLNKNTPIQSFIVTYDDNDDIKNIDYKFTLNNKSSLIVLEILVRSTLIDLTDKGYEVLANYMDFPYKNKKTKGINYMTSDKVLSFYKNEEDQFVFLVR